MPDIDWRRLPPLASLRAFEATARLETFSAAARALNVTPAAVAQQVRALEEELGVSLVRRAGRGLSLTPGGARLGASLTDAFSQVAGAVETARNADRERGIRVASTPTFGSMVLMPRLQEFWREHPGTPLSLSPNEKISDLRRGQYDLAIRSGTGDWPDGQAELLFASRYVLVGAPGLVGDDPDIRALPWIGPVSGLDHRAMESLDIDPGKVTLHGLESQALFVPAAVQGVGLLLAAEAVVRSEIETGQLVEIPMPETPPMNLWIVTPQGPVRPAVRDFIDWLRKTFGDKRKTVE
ncbi:LysR substrate-binding domain-containing protein [Pseudoruegeria sp. HB172150]|uniref:LysR substrate-binding domain-containing protein n=1 Tax=Pseudoruegeria sp. HB172150 TaxID=2721164 RepID=UPI0015540BF0|nr:LysR substrate-binding domain-containing protein [Pseudoruegeria sp. HB172150]